MSTGAFVARRNGHVFITGNSGFPKSLDISKAIDKAAGAEREVIGRRPDWVVSDKWRETEGRADRPESILDITAPATDSAKEWQGYGTALKPAFEPICLAMKPLDGTFAHNALTHGVAGLNIDGARIPTTDKLQTLEGSFSFSGSGGANETGKKIAFRDAGQGRWPANLLLSHTPECKCVGTKKVKGDGHFPKSRYKETDIFGGGKGLPINTGHEEVQMGEEEVESWECTPDCPVRMLDEQSGERPSNGIYRKQGVSETSGGFIRTWDRTYEQRNQYAGDIGGASRFFYTAKASRSERDPMCEELLRNDHATVKPLDLMIYLVKLVMPPKNGVVLDPFMGSGTTGLACQKLGVRFMGIDNKERNCEIAARRMSQSVMQL